MRPKITDPEEMEMLIRRFNLNPVQDELDEDERVDRYLKRTKLTKNKAR